MQKIKITVLTFGLFLISSCSIFQSKYVEIQRQDGKCWDIYNANLISNEVLETNKVIDSELMIELINVNDAYSGIDDLDFDNIIVKLKGYSINYELKFRFETQHNIRIPRDEYLISVFSTNEDDDFNIDLEKISLNAGEKRKIKIEISKRTPCETYIFTEKVLRSELRKNKKRN